MKRIIILLFLGMMIFLYGEEQIVLRVIKDNIMISEPVPIFEDDNNSYFVTASYRELTTINLKTFECSYLSDFNEYYGNYKDKVIFAKYENNKATYFLYDYKNKTKTKTNMLDTLDFINVHHRYQYYQNDQLIFADLNGDGSYFDGFVLYLYNINSKELKILIEDDHGWGLLDISEDKMHQLLDRGNKITVYNMETNKETVLKGADIKYFFRYQWFISNKLIAFEDGTIYHINGEKVATYTFKPVSSITKDSVDFYTTVDVFFNKLNNGIIRYYNETKKMKMEAIVDASAFKTSLEKKVCFSLNAKGK